jgi:hypothetical protein
MVTDGRWKLVWNFSDLCELYDLEADPHELRNRFYDPACRDVRDRYAAALLAEARRLGDGQALAQSITVEAQLGRPGDERASHGGAPKRDPHRDEARSKGR